MCGAHGFPFFSIFPFLFLPLSQILSWIYICLFLSLFPLSIWPFLSPLTFLSLFFSISFSSSVSFSLSLSFNVSFSFIFSLFLCLSVSFSLSFFLFFPLFISFLFPISLANFTLNISFLFFTFCPRSLPSYLFHLFLVNEKACEISEVSFIYIQLMNSAWTKHPNISLLWARAYRISILLCLPYIYREAVNPWRRSLHMVTY